jgi:long-chain acyl-CoA synthetase
MPKTLIDIFIGSMRRDPNAARFKRKRGGAWEEISGERALVEVESLALGLHSLGIRKGDQVAILSETRYEWAVADLAILSLGAVTVPIYSTLTAAQTGDLLQRSDTVGVILSSATQIEKIRQSGAIDRLRAIVHLEPFVATEPAAVSYADLVERGSRLRTADAAAYGRLVEQVRPDDLATIIFTSGTTAEPKGGMLTHANIASNVTSCLELVELGQNDICLSFLPLSHIFERMAGLYAMLEAGATIAYAEGFETVAANALEVRPTVLVGVPRFYEKVYARVMENAATQPGWRQAIFRWGLERGLEKAHARFEGREMNTLATRLADRLVGAQVRARVGGRLRYCFSGGAPLSPKIIEFFFAVGIPVLEGYGLTETSPVICLNQPGHEKPGSVGKPVPGVEVRIVEQGEIVARGPNVMKGYYKNEEATRAAIRDGWFHTGDIGQFDADGNLVITDRLKDLLVTAGGKKVAPQPVEARLKEGRWIAEAVLLGDQKPFIVCLIVPKFGVLENEARAQGWAFDSRAALLARPEVRALFETEIEQVNATAAPFEKIKRFALIDRELSADQGEITPSLKVKRKIVAQHFDACIQELYAGHVSPTLSR